MTRTFHDCADFDGFDEFDDFNVFDDQPISGFLSLTVSAFLVSSLIFGTPGTLAWFLTWSNGISSKRSQRR